MNCIHATVFETWPENLVILTNQNNGHRFIAECVSGGGSEDSSIITRPVLWYSNEPRADQHHNAPTLEWVLAPRCFSYRVITKEEFYSMVKISDV